MFRKIYYELNIAEELRGPEMLNMQTNIVVISFY